MLRQAAQSVLTLKGTAALALLPLPANNLVMPTAIAVLIRIDLRLGRAAAAVKIWNM